MALNLVQIAKQTRDPLQKTFILDLLRYSDLVRVVNFTPVPGLKVTGQRWQTLPSAGFRKINGGYTESTGTTEEVQETLSLLGGDIKFDKIAERVTSWESPARTQMKMKSKAVAFTFNDYFINGDNGSDPDGFEGLKKRNSNMPSRMSIDLSSTGDSLKVLANATNEKKFLDALHSAIAYVDGATHMFMNETVKLGFGTMMRDLGLATETLELYEKVFDSFRRVPMVDVGLKGDKSTEIITNTEDPGDAGNDSTSIYVVRMDQDDGLHGLSLQGMDMQPYDPLNGNEMEAGPQFLRRIDWAVGLANLSQYCICRIKGFKMAAA